MTIDNELKMNAQTISKWAAEFAHLETVHVFGSRVRGDHRADSDLDIAFDIRESVENTTFDKELDTNCDGLKELLPDGIKLDVHKDHNDDAWPRIRTGKCVHQEGKVQCVITAPWPLKEQ